jgi:hypothetical protein
MVKKRMRRLVCKRERPKTKRSRRERRTGRRVRKREKLLLLRDRRRRRPSTHPLPGKRLIEETTS